MLNDLMKNVRQLDNRASQWFLRHFYVLFFEIILVVIFFFFFANVINVINISADIRHGTIIERLLLTQDTLSLLILFLLLLNSFWMLFMFNSLIRVRAILKNVDFNLSRRKNDRRKEDEF